MTRLIKTDLKDMPNQYKYYAFISYNQKDFGQAKRLFHKLEYYKMSSSLCKQHGWNTRKPISPIFFAPYDIQPDELTDELKKRLRDSQYLIVVCSPNSAHSKWVQLEIDYFCRELNRRDRIHFFIIDGEPNSDDSSKECYNDAVFELGLEGKLGVNIHEKVYRWSWLNKERAYVQLITKLLNVEFDTVWQRHKRMLLQQLMACVFLFLSFISAIICTWIYNQPKNVEVSLKDMSVINPNLPQLNDGKMSIQIGDSVYPYIFHDNTQVVSVPNVPRRLLGSKSHLTFQAEGFLPIDTTLNIEEKIVLPVLRDIEYYGLIKGEVRNKITDDIVSNTTLQINDTLVCTDGNGMLNVLIPLTKQQESYTIYKDNIRIGMFYMPRMNNPYIIVNINK